MGVNITKIKNESLTDIINQELTNINIKQLQEHKASFSSSQTIDLESEDGDIEVNNISMNNTVNISLDSYQTTLNKNLLKTAIINSIDKFNKNNLNNSSVVPGFNKTEIDTFNKTNIINKIENNITEEQISNCLVNSYNKQQIKSKTKSGNIRIKNINMKSIATISAKCITEMVVDIIKDTNINNIVKEKTDNNVTNSLFNSNYIYGILFILLCSFILCILIIVIFFLSIKK